MTDARWDPAQYGRFSDERSRPFCDLVSRIRTDSPRRVVDLGCGPGTLTATLARRWSTAHVIGLDSSVEMIEAAGHGVAAPDNLSFELADISEWTPSPVDDVVVTNAALQWVPHHRELLPKWFDELPAGATFAMQVPGNFGSASHVLLRHIADSARWRSQLHGVLRGIETVGDPSHYLEIALDAGLRAEAWETTYLHVLHGENPVLEWTSGTALGPVRAVLSEAEFAEFRAEYGACLVNAYPAGRHGTIYPFRRVFLVATK